MRYDANERRIVLEAAVPAVEEIVLAVYSLAVPRHTRKLYFVPEGDVTCPKLKTLASQGQDFKIVPRDRWPLNLCDKFRIMQDGANLIVIPSDDARLTKDDVERIAQTLSTLSSSNT